MQYVECEDLMFLNSSFYRVEDLLNVVLLLEHKIFISVISLNVKIFSFNSLLKKQKQTLDPKVESIGEKSTMAHSLTHLRTSFYQFFFY